MQLYKLLLLISALGIQNIAGAQIGDVFEQTGSPGEIQRESGEQLIAKLNAPIVSMDTVQTENGRLKIKFVDDTQVSMTEHTVVEINEYVYDPNPSNSKMALNFAQGTARFATGKLGLVPRENIAIQTPTASIGIRGTDFTMTVDELGRSLVILLPDEDCDDKVKLEEGCKPSGSISVTNNGGEVILTEAYQAVMVSTFETSPTQPVTIQNLDLNMIDNMFIVSPPAKIQEEVERETETRGGIDYLAFDGLDQDFLEQDLLEDNFENLEFTELDIDYLNINFLADLLDVLDTSLDMDPIAKDNLRQGPDKITGTINPGFDEKTLYNTILEDSEGIVFLRIIDGQGKISLRIPAGSNARIETEAEPTKSIICVNDCSDINIYIRQGNG
jgi:hypothetical protein